MPDCFPRLSIDLDGDVCLWLDRYTVRLLGPLANSLYDRLDRSLWPQLDDLFDHERDAVWTEQPSPFCNAERTW